MKYSAVIFDLFGTLANNFAAREYEEALLKMASVLSLPPDDFRQAWSDSSKVRNDAARKRCESRIELICNTLGTPRERILIDHAARVRFDYIRQVMEPRPDAVAVISELREKGFKIGLISDCSDEVPVIWPDTPLCQLFDVSVFSCLAGFRKPDPRIYDLAVKQLNVLPEKCLYVGDGGSQELTGALKAGMHPVMIRLDAGSTEKHLASREEWNGPAVGSLREILTIVTRDQP